MTGKETPKPLTMEELGNALKKSCWDKNIHIVKKDKYHKENQAIVINDHGCGGGECDCVINLDQLLDLINNKQKEGI